MYISQIIEQLQAILDSEGDKEFVGQEDGLFYEFSPDSIKFDEESDLVTFNIDDCEEF